MNGTPKHSVMRVYLPKTGFKYHNDLECCVKARPLSIMNTIGAGSAGTPRTSTSEAGALVDALTSLVFSRSLGRTIR